MKKKILLFVLSVLCLAAMLGGMLAAQADEAPATNIAGHNLSLDDSVQIIYYVDQTAPEGAEVGVLCWFDPQESYTIENAQYHLAQNGTRIISGKEYAQYNFPYVAAKMMTQDVYAVSYVKVGDAVTYSKLDKYSVLQYCYNKKGSTAIATASSTATLGELVTDLLNYGATAQKYFNFNTARLANADYYQIKVVNGVLEDGTAKGLYQAGETISLKATVPSGYQIVWKNSAGEIVGTQAEINVTAAAKDETYTAEAYSRGLAFTSNGDGTCSVTGIGTCTDYDIVIPPVSPAGDRVTSIGNFAFQQRFSLTSVIIPDGVTSIGNYAFYECTSLTSIIIPDDVTSIGDWALENCTALTSITIPDSVTSIGVGAFSGCISLTSITIPNTVTSIGNHVFAYCQSLESITVVAGNPAYHSAGNCLIETASKILIAGCKSSVIPDDGNVTSIEYGAFAGQTFLTGIAIPESLTSIGIQAFLGCTSLTSVTFGENSQLTSIGNAAFYGCTSLTSITIPDSVTSIEAHAFCECTSLMSVTFEENSQLTNIERYTFYGCKSLTNVTIPDSVTSIGESAFQDCITLTSVTIPDNVTSIGLEAFASCTSLRYNDVYDNAQYLGNANNPYVVLMKAIDTSITSCSIHPNTKVILDGAFDGCALTSVTIPDGVTSIGWGAFRYCDFSSITIPNSVVSIERAVFVGCTSLSEIIFLGTEEEWNAIYKGDDWDYNTGSYTVIFQPVIGPSEGLEFESNEDGTCALIGMGDCTDTDVVIPERSSDGDLVTSIDGSAFSGEAITSVTIPVGIEEIGRNAFKGCTELTDVYYAGTAAQWEAIDIKSGNAPLTSATLHTNEVFYTVTFLDYDGRQLKTEQVAEGESATAPADPERAGYTFAGWDKSFANVTGDLTVTATYEIVVSDPTILVDAVNASAGDTATVNIKIKNNPGIAGATLTISYDENLTLTAASSGETFSLLNYTEPGEWVTPCNFLWDSQSGEVTDDGVILTLQFTVSAGAQSGAELAVTCTYRVGDIYNEALDNVILDVVNGKVIVA